MLVDVIKNDRLDLKDFLISANHAEPAPVESLKLFKELDVESFDNLNVIEMGRTSFCIATHVVDPNEFYIMEHSDLKKYEGVLSESQDCVETVLNPELGQLCLTRRDGILLRVKIMQLTRDRIKAKVIFIDSGKTEKEYVSNLVLPNIHQNEVNGLAKQVGLANSKPLTGNVWSEESIDAFKQILNVLTEKLFKFEIVEEPGKIQLTNADGTDVLDLLISMGFAAAKDTADSSSTETNVEYTPRTPAQSRLSRCNKTNVDGHQSPASIDPSPGSSYSKKEDGQLVEVDQPSAVPQNPLSKAKNIHEIKDVQKLVKVDQKSKLQDPIKPDTQLTIDIKNVGLAKPKGPSPNEQNKCIISWINNVGDFYLFPESQNSLFETILEDCQDPGPALDKAEVGTMCLCCIDTIWYRARVGKVSPDRTKAKLFLVDVGRLETKPVSSLRQLKGHQETADIVEKVGLAGVEPLVGDKWSEESTKIFKELVDAGEGNSFFLTRVGNGSMVQITDWNGVDLGGALIELELVKASTSDEVKGMVV